MQWGPIPPSGGPRRDRYLEYYGQTSLSRAFESYSEVLSLLDRLTPQMPDLPSPLVEIDDDLRWRIQQEKRAEWNEFRASLGQALVDTVEPHIKASVSAAVAALNYLEDHPLREAAHQAIHRAAFVRRGLLGCPIVLRDDEYWTDCPVNLSHMRIGLSAGMVSNFDCSVCGRPDEDCEHQRGQFYPRRAGRDGTGKCDICGATSCPHTEDQEFLVEAHASAGNAEVGEVSLVSRPRYPQARLVKITKNIGSDTGDQPWRRAAELGLLNCDADLGPCSGLNEIRPQDLPTLLA